MKVAVKTFPRDVTDEALEEWINGQGRVVSYQVVPFGSYIRVIVEYMEKDTLLEE